MLGIGRHLPGDIGLDQDAQAVARSDILQAARVVRSRRSTAIVLSTGAGIFQARPGSVRTRIGSPKRVTTTAWPGPTKTRQALRTAAATIRKATRKRP